MPDEPDIPEDEEDETADHAIPPDMRELHEVIEWEEATKQ
jgi:hypothetical protein